MRIWKSIAAVLVCSAAMPVFAAPPLQQRIDELIEAKAGGVVAGAADDAELLRRVTLDLTGIVPTESEARAFLADRDSEKRTKLIDRLFASPGYARRMREAFTVMLLERRTGSTVPDADWNTFLESTFATNKPWDQFVNELFQADAANEQSRGSVKFFVDGGRATHEQMTQDVARLFLGMNIHCAKCHDHPSVDQFKQADYFGLLAFLNQSKPAKHAKLKRTFLVEAAASKKLEFQSVFFPDQKHQVGPRLPGKKEVAIPVFEKGQEFAKPAADGLPGEPKFRPRLLLAARLTDATNRRFVINAVNRFWYLMMGRGLIQPLDMIHDKNPASHPVLLNVLADEFIAHKFDVKWLLREMALSKTYQRSSVLPAGVDVKDAPPQAYRVANAKGLTPEQSAWSIMRATGVLERVVKTAKSGDAKYSFKDYINGRIPAPTNFDDTMSLFVSVFGSPPGEPEIEFQPSMGQALFLMNEQLVLDWLKPKDGNLIARVESESDSPKIAEVLYLNILSRFPSDEESRDVSEFLEQNKNRRMQAIGDYAWALLASAEFKLNH